MVPDQHMWVYYVGIAGAIVTALSVAFPKVREMISPIFGFFSNYEVRKIERQARIETAARILNDERNRILSIQLAGVAAQLEGVLRQAREDAERYQTEIIGVRKQLNETQESLVTAMVEIAKLRSELAEYRHSIH